MPFREFHFEFKALERPAYTRQRKNSTFLGFYLVKVTDPDDHDGQQEANS